MQMLPVVSATFEVSASLEWLTSKLNPAKLCRTSPTFHLASPDQPGPETETSCQRPLGDGRLRSTGILWKPLKTNMAQWWLTLAARLSLKQRKSPRRDKTRRDTCKSGAEAAGLLRTSFAQQSCKAAATLLAPISGHKQPNGTEWLRFGLSAAN